MSKYIALLRGVNVSGHNPVAMADLRKLFGALGFSDVTTYVQSGNVVFEAPHSTRANRYTHGGLRTTIEDGIAEEFGLDVKVLVRSHEDLARVVATNPFVGKVAPTALHVTFLADKPKGSSIWSLDADAYLPDTFAAIGNEVFVVCPSGYGRTTINNAFFEKKLAVPATTRNWKTVTKLIELSD